MDNFTDNFTDLQTKSILEFDCSKLEISNETSDVDEIIILPSGGKSDTSNIAIKETINGKNSFKCTICDYTAHYVPNYDLAYQNHMRTHDGALRIYDNLPVPCTECDFRCKYHLELSQHMLEHKNKPLYTCSDCEYKNLCEKQFNDHTKKLSHKIKCSKCEAKFVNLFAMKIHLSSHITHYCQICKCDVTFNTKYELNRHIEKHQKESTFTCKLCEKRFQHISHLKFHLLSHKGRGKNSKLRPRSAI